MYACECVCTLYLAYVHKCTLYVVHSIVRAVQSVHTINRTVKKLKQTSRIVTKTAKKDFHFDTNVCVWWCRLYMYSCVYKLYSLYSVQYSNMCRELIRGWKIKIKGLLPKNFNLQSHKCSIELPLGSQEFYTWCVYMCVFLRKDI